MRSFVHIFIVCVVAAVMAMAVPARAAEAALPKEMKVELNDKNADSKDEKDAKDNKDKDNKQQPVEEKHESVPVKVDVEPMVYDGIDVSRHQKDIDWDEVARDKNIKYAYIKATEGATFVDPRYRANIEGARRVGIKVGAYHFLRTGTKVEDQFNNFTNTVKKGEQDLIPLLDVEVKQGWTNQQLRDSVKVFLDLLEEHYGCKPMIYTSSSFFNTILGRAFAEYPLFIARYATNEPRLDNGAQWIMWQFSEKGRVRGIDHAVDMSRFNKGRSLRDILIKDNKLNQRKRKTTDVVDKSHEKPATINVPKKEAPVMSAQQEKELKKKQEKEQKARERAEKLAQEDAAKKKAEQEKKAQQKKAPVQAQPSQVEQAEPSNSPKPVRRRTGTATTTKTTQQAAKASIASFVDHETSVQAAAKAQADKEAKELAEKEQKAREKAEREAREKAAKEQAAREKQAAKERAAREKAAKEQAAREKAAREKAEREAEKKVDKMVKAEIEKQEQAEAEKAREEAKRKAIEEKRAKAAAKAQAELEEEAKRDAVKKAQQQKKLDTKAKLQQQKAASATVKQSTAKSDTTTKATATPTKKKTNKSSADND